jgi:hypothetical protein
VGQGEERVSSLRGWGDGPNKGFLEQPLAERDPYRGGVLYKLRHRVEGTQGSISDYAKPSQGADIQNIHRAEVKRVCAPAP